jgi:hypothetical protein
VNPNPTDPLPDATTTDDPRDLAQRASGMTCERVAELLGEYAARTLSANAKSGLELHVSLCPACSQEAEQYFEVIRLAESLTAPVPSPQAEERIKARLRAAVKPPPSANPLSETTPDVPPLQ